MFKKSVMIALVALLSSSVKAHKTHPAREDHTGDAQVGTTAFAEVKKEGKTSHKLAQTKSDPDATIYYEWVDEWMYQYDEDGDGLVSLDDILDLEKIFLLKGDTEMTDQQE
jgi:hypothetical protein